MKYTILILLFPFIAMAQRDSLTNSFLTFEDYSTTIDGEFMYISINYSSRGGTHYTERDTIDKDNLGAWCDEMIAMIQNDSIVQFNVANSIYNQFRDQNTLRLNTKNRLIKLWALKPE